MNIFQNAIQTLRRGLIIAHATETCYGFACDAFNKKALARLYKIKQMNLKKPVSIMISSLTMAKKYGIFTKLAIRLAKKYWPGPLTLIVKRKKLLPAFLNPHAKTIGLRMPAHKLSLALVKKIGRPLTTTSANVSGKPSPYSASAIRRQFQNIKNKPDSIIDSGRIKKNPPSTIIDVSGDHLKIIRQGGLTRMA